MNATRVLLVRDHVLVRAGICALREKIANIKVAGEAGSGREGLELIK
jgi:DNA-binding NarL/FixJ family response regulator